MKTVFLHGSTSATAHRIAQHFQSLGGWSVISNDQIPDKLDLFVDCCFEVDASSSMEKALTEAVGDAHAAFLAALPALKEARGHAIFLTTEHYELTVPDSVITSTIQGARVSLMRALTVEIANAGVACNAVVLNPDSEASMTEAIRMIEFLASGACRFMQGTPIKLTGTISSKLHDPA